MIINQMRTATGRLTRATSAEAMRANRSGNACRAKAPCALTAGDEFGNEGLAQLCLAAAAVSYQEEGQSAETIEIGAIDDRPTLPFGDDETRPSESCQVARHRILRHVDEPRDLAGRHAVGLVLYERPVSLEPGPLRQSGESSECRIDIHISRIADTSV